MTLPELNQTNSQNASYCANGQDKLGDEILVMSSDIQITFHPVKHDTMGSEAV